MKKIIFCLSFVVLALTASAQKGAMAGGIQLGYGSEIKNFGIGVNFQYGITDAIDLVPSFNYFFEKDHVYAWDINADFHYNFAIADDVKAYPLAGLTYSTWGVSDVTVGGYTVEGSSDGYLGFNFGGGILYDLTETIAVGAELKYQLLTGDGSDGSQVVFGVKGVYKF